MTLHCIAVLQLQFSIFQLTGLNRFEVEDIYIYIKKRVFEILTIQVTINSTIRGIERLLISGITIQGTKFLSTSNCLLLGLQSIMDIYV